MISIDRLTKGLAAACLIYSFNAVAQNKAAPGTSPKAKAPVAAAPVVDMTDPIAVADMKFKAKNYEEALGDYLKLLEGNEKK